MSATAARAGYRFQDLWCLARALALLDRRSAPRLLRLSLEGSLDGGGARRSDPSELVVDAEEELSDGTRVAIQLKHAATPREPFSWSELAPLRDGPDDYRGSVWRGFAMRLEQLPQNGSDPAAHRFVLIVNRPVKADLAAALRLLAGRPDSGDEAHRSIAMNLKERACLSDDKVARLAGMFSIRPPEAGLAALQARLDATLAQLGADPADQLMRRLADGLAEDLSRGAKVTLNEETLLQRLGCADRGDLFPAPPAAVRSAKVVPRAAWRDLAQRIAEPEEHPLVIAAAGGVGKSAFLTWLAEAAPQAVLPAGSRVLIHDCFGSGDYRSMRRHTLATAAAQIVNTLWLDGLCAPLVLPDETAAPERLRRRLEEAAAELRRASPDALLIVALDAVDNAAMAAAARGETATVLDLLGPRNWPEGVRVIATLRPERAKDALEWRDGARRDVRCVTLPPLDDAECAELVGERVSRGAAAELGRLCGGNPRVLWRMISRLERGEAPEDLLASLRPGGRSLDDVLAEDLEHRLQRATNEAPATNKTSTTTETPATNETAETRKLLPAVLGLLPAPIPAAIAADATGCPLELIASFAADFDGLILTSEGLTFTDEPTETFFRERGRACRAAADAAVKALRRLPAADPYALRALPGLLVVVEDWPALIALALEPPPSLDPATRREVVMARCRFGLRAALRTEKLFEAAMIGDRLGWAQEHDSQLDQFLIAQADLAGAFGLAPAVERTALAALRRWRGRGEEGIERPPLREAAAAVLAWAAADAPDEAAAWWARQALAIEQGDHPSTRDEVQTPAEQLAAAALIRNMNWGRQGSRRHWSQAWEPEDAVARALAHEPEAAARLVAQLRLRRWALAATVAAGDRAGRPLDWPRMLEAAADASNDAEAFPERASDRAAWMLMLLRAPQLIDAWPAPRLIDATQGAEEPGWRDDHPPEAWVLALALLAALRGLRHGEDVTPEDLLSRTLLDRWRKGRRRAGDRPGPARDDEIRRFLLDEPPEHARQMEPFRRVLAFAKAAWLAAPDAFEGENGEAALSAAVAGLKDQGRRRHPQYPTHDGPIARLWLECLAACGRPEGVADLVAAIAGGSEREGLSLTAAQALGLAGRCFALGWADQGWAIVDMVEERQLPDEPAERAETLTTIARLLLPRSRDEAERRWRLALELTASQVVDWDSRIVAASRAARAACASAHLMVSWSTTMIAVTPLIRPMGVVATLAPRFAAAPPIAHAAALDEPAHSNHRLSRVFGEILADWQDAGRVTRADANALLPLAASLAEDRPASEAAAADEAELRFAPRPRTTIESDDTDRYQTEVQATAAAALPERDAITGFWAQVQRDQARRFGDVIELLLAARQRWPDSALPDRLDDWLADAMRVRGARAVYLSSDDPVRNLTANIDRVLPPSDPRSQPLKRRLILWRLDLAAEPEGDGAAFAPALLTPFLSAEENARLLADMLDRMRAAMGPRWTAVADGPNALVNPRLGAAPDHGPELVAELLWLRLASPIAEARWRAAHAVVRLGRNATGAEALAALVRRAMGQADSPLHPPGHGPFLAKHARTWLLLALARLATEAPAAVVSHLELLRTALAEPHVLNRGLAARALRAIPDLDPALRVAAEGALQPARTTSAPTISVFQDRYIEDKYGLNIHWDFPQYWLNGLGRAFDIDLRDLLCRITDRLRADGVVVDDRWADERKPSFAFEPLRWLDDLDLDDPPRALAWHALHEEAGALLAERPAVVPGPDDGWLAGWPDWIDSRLPARADGRWVSDLRTAPPPALPPPRLLERWRAERRWSDPDRLQAWLGMAGPARLVAYGYVELLHTGYERAEAASVVTLVIPKGDAELVRDQLRALAAEREINLGDAVHVARRRDPDRPEFQRLAPWIVDRGHGGESGIESHDPFAAGCLWPPVRFDDAAQERFGLMPDDPDLRRWTCDDRIVAERWTFAPAGSGNDGDPRPRGEALAVDRAWLVDALARLDHDLLIAVEWRDWGFERDKDDDRSCPSSCRLYRLDPTGAPIPIR